MRAREHDRIQTRKARVAEVWQLRARRNRGRLEKTKDAKKKRIDGAVVSIIRRADRGISI
jgi:hypothetical protein